jgi:hypothetical protein
LDMVSAGWHGGYIALRSAKEACPAE